MFSSCQKYPVVLCLHMLECQHIIVVRGLLGLELYGPCWTVSHYLLSFHDLFMFYLEKLLCCIFFCFLYWNIFSVRTQGGLATEANGDGELKLNKSFISVKRRGTQEFVLTLIMYHLHLFFLITCIFSVSFTHVQMFWFWLHVFLCLV